MLDLISNETRKVAAMLCAMSFLASGQSLAAQERQHLLMATGNDALTTCTTSPDDSVMAASICIAWMQGVRDGHRMTASIFGFYDPVWCAPASDTNGQYRDVFVKHLRDNPARRHQPACILFLDAMLEALPCPNEAGAN